VQGLGYLQDKFPDGSSGPLQDICPFTVMGTFNRGMTDANRKLIAAELAKLLGVTVPVPATFEGIPVLNNQRSGSSLRGQARAGDVMPYGASLPQRRRWLKTTGQAPARSS
jgi:5-methylcytosine-specific restriction protein B